MTHVCTRCGASCEGLKVRPQADERARIAIDAERLGISRPFAGPFLRQNWGRCVFYAHGCRLHAEIGADAKPRVCRQFPVSARGVDPACFFPGNGTGTGRFVFDDLSIGAEIQRRLVGLPLVAVLRPAKLGQMTVEGLTGLDTGALSVPLSPGRAGWLCERAIAAGLPYADGEAERLLVGGVQLLAGAGREDRFAAWARLLRIGVL